MTFLPPVPLPESQQFYIDVTIPDWYNIDNGAKQAYMYSETFRDKCSSDQFQISSSRFSVGNLRIIIEKFDSYVQGEQATFSCLGYRNPIYPALWNGFRF